MATLNLVIPATPDAIPAVADDVMHLLESSDWPEDDRAKIDLALQEALANGIRHGCQGDASKQVRCCVVCDEEENEVVIVIRDEGNGFNPDAVPDPRTPENVWRTHGRGVFLIRELMDDVTFADGGREVWMRRQKRAA